MAHERAIFCTAIGCWDSAKWQIEETIERPEWWLPLKRSHGQELGDELARRVRETWEERFQLRG